MKLHGARVLVVGGGSGIGFAVAKGALAEGARVMIASTNRAKLEAAAEQLVTSEIEALQARQTP